MNNQLELKTQKLIETIEAEKLDCVEWYKNHLRDEFDIPEDSLVTPDDVAYEMEGVETNGATENMFYSSGYLRGLQHALSILKSK